jgi:transcriptional regulator with XRE-family HTH domain
MPAELDLDDQFGERCMEMRAVRDLSQTDLCLRADISNGVLSSIENHRRMPTVPVVIKVCQALEVSADYMLGISEDSLPAGPLGCRLLRSFARLSTVEQEIVVKLCDALAGEKPGKAGQGHKSAVG